MEKGLNNFLPLVMFLGTKNYCFCCLIFALVFTCFVFFVLQKLFLKDFYVCPDTLIYYTTCS